MSSAHRPTFDHARGKEKKVASTISHKRALPSHSKLKFRSKKARNNKEFYNYSKEETGESSYNVNQELLEPLRSDIQKTVQTIETRAKEEVDSLNERVGDATSSDGKGEGTENEVTYESARVGENHDEEKSAGESEDESQSGSETGSDEDEDEDEALLKEIENIRKEREEAKRKAEEEKIEQRAMSSNPLLSVEGSNEGVAPDMKPKKKSWRSVKTMSKKPNMSHTDRFSNDTLKSDFHKDFLDRYIQ